MQIYKINVSALSSGYAPIQVELTETYSEVYLKTIRFNVLLKETNDHAFYELPYQFHLNWLDRHKLPYHKGRIMSVLSTFRDGNGFRYDQIDTNATVETAYSTLCQFTSIGLYTSLTPKLGSESDPHYTCYTYEMQRDALIRKSGIHRLDFEIFFTNVDGLVYVLGLPNVELEFELY